MSDATSKAVRVLISGRVQGVSFRYWAEGEAEARGLAGWVRNLRDGRVEAVFQGPAPVVDQMVEACWEGPQLARVDDVVEEPGPPVEDAGFKTLPTATL